MSDQPQPQDRGSTPGRNPWVTALLILIGLVLLLPGLCSLIFTAVLLSDPGGLGGGNSGYVGLLFFCFLVGVGGVALIVFAIRR
jgi:hypothetical protein